MIYLKGKRITLLFEIGKCPKVGGDYQLISKQKWWPKI